MPHNSSGYTHSRIYAKPSWLRHFARMTRLFQAEEFKTKVHDVHQFSFPFMKSFWKRGGSWIRGVQAMISSCSTVKGGGVVYNSDSIIGIGGMAYK